MSQPHSPSKDEKQAEPPEEKRNGARQPHSHEDSLSEKRLLAKWNQALTGVSELYMKQREAIEEREA